MSKQPKMVHKTRLQLSTQTAAAAANLDAIFKTRAQSPYPIGTWHAFCYPWCTPAGCSPDDLRQPNATPIKRTQHGFAVTTHAYK